MGTDPRDAEAMRVVIAEHSDKEAKLRTSRRQSPPGKSCYRLPFSSFWTFLSKIFWFIWRSFFISQKGFTIFVHNGTDFVY